METKDLNNPEEQDKRPDFLKDTPEIEKWRHEQAVERTKQRRPDLNRGTEH